MKPHSHSLAVAFALLIAGTFQKLPAEVRAFTDLSGKLIRGELVAINADFVTIKREDGQTFTIKAAAFCASDIAYFQEHGLKAAASSPTPGTPELKNTFAGIPFGTPKELAVKALIARTKTQEDPGRSSPDKIEFRGGVYENQPVNRLVLEFKDDKLSRAFVFVVSSSPERRGEFELFKRLLTAKHGTPSKDEANGKHLRTEWSTPVAGSNEPATVSCDTDSSGHDGLKISYAGPMAAGATVAIAPTGPAGPAKPFSPTAAPGLAKKSPFVGTKWQREDSTIEFFNTGNWHEKWLKKNYSGTWKVKSDFEVVVSRSDGMNLEYSMSGDGKVVTRKVGGIKYERTP